MYTFSNSFRTGPGDGGAPADFEMDSLLPNARGASGAGTEREVRRAPCAAGKALPESSDIDLRVADLEAASTPEGNEFRFEALGNASEGLRAPAGGGGGNDDVCVKISFEPARGIALTGGNGGGADRGDGVTEPRRARG